MKHLQKHIPAMIAVAAALALPASAAWADIKIGFNVPLTGFAPASA